MASRWWATNCCLPVLTRCGPLHDGIPAVPMSWSNQAVLDTGPTSIVVVVAPVAPEASARSSPGAADPSRSRGRCLPRRRWPPRWDPRASLTCPAGTAPGVAVVAGTIVAPGGLAGAGAVIGWPGRARPASRRHPATAALLRAPPPSPAGNAQRARLGDPARPPVPARPVGVAHGDHGLTRPWCCSRPSAARCTTPPSPPGTPSGPSTRCDRSAQFRHVRPGLPSGHRRWRVTKG